MHMHSILCDAPSFNSVCGFVPHLDAVNSPTKWVRRIYILLHLWCMNARFSVLMVNCIYTYLPCRQNLNMDHPTFREQCRICGPVFYSADEAEQHCYSPCLSPHLFASQPPQTSSTSFPTLTVANSDTMSSRQPGTSTSPATGVIRPQAASTQHHSPVPPAGSAVTVTRPTYWATYLLQENRQLRKRNSDYRFSLCWCLHHLHSHRTPPPSAGDDVDMALRRIVRHSTTTPHQIDETSSFEDVVSKLHDFYLDTD